MNTIPPQYAKRTLHSTNTTGYNGVSKKGRKFKVQIRAEGKQKYLGMFACAKEAALLFDRAVIQYKLPRSLLNYPDGLPIDDEDYDEIMNPHKKRKLASTNTSGYNGVSKERKRFSARIKINGKRKHLGAYDTPKEAALAYDRAVTHHKLPASKLNFPNGYTASTSSEEESKNDEASDAADDKSDGKVNMNLHLLVAAVEAQTNTPK